MQLESDKYYACGENKQRSGMILLSILDNKDVHITAYLVDIPATPQSKRAEPRWCALGTRDGATVGHSADVEWTKTKNDRRGDISKDVDIRTVFADGERQRLRAWGE